MNTPSEQMNVGEINKNIPVSSSPRNYALSGSDLPSAILGGDPLELLAWNKNFANVLSNIRCCGSINGFQNQKSFFLDEISRVFTQEMQAKKNASIVFSLPTKAGIERFEMTSKLMDSTDQPAMLITFNKSIDSIRNQDKSKNPEIDFKTLFLQAPVMMMQLSGNGELQYANQKWLQTTGYDLKEIQWTSFASFLDESSRADFAELLGNLKHGEQVSDVPLILQLKNGKCKSVSITLCMSESVQKLDLIVGVLQENDFTSSDDDERMLANALRETAAALTSTLNFDEVLDQILVSVGQVVPNEAANVMMIFSGVAYIVRSNGYAERGLEDAVMSLQLPVTQDPHLLSMFETGMPLAVKDVSEYAGIQHYEGSDWPCSVASAPLRSKGQVFGFLNLESSVSGFYDQKHADRLQAFADQAAVAIENARLYAEVQQYAITDELTTLYNRRGLYELGKREVERAHRYNRSLAAIMIDTDKFKSINDTYSHAVGDQVLRGLADRIRGCIREVDIPGRYGGDEFVVLLPETDLRSALQVAERLRVSVCESGMQTSAGEIPLSISVGVAEISPEANSFDILLEKADSAMFKAKEQGKNQVVG